MKYFVTLLAVCFVSPALSGQQQSLSKLNLPHAGDSIIKQQVEFVDPGASGRDITWDFRTVHPVNDSYNLRYRAITADTLQIAGIEHRTVYRYRVQGDTLLHTGYENATTLMTYTQPEAKMRFPFRYADTITSHFVGTGEYCHRLPLHVEGTTTVTADATGILLTPDGQQHKNVLRVKSLRAYSQTGVDSVTMRLETYSWYVPGNRYPVFETVKTATRKTGSEETEHQVASFFYPPVDQTQQTDTTGLGQGLGQGGPEVAPIDRILTTCKLLPNPVQSQLMIEYDLSQDATVSFSVHDNVGVPKITTAPIRRTAGHYTETLQMGGFVTGIYPLYVTVEGMVKTLSVVKR
jgi:hypothetical protein